MVTKRVSEYKTTRSISISKYIAKRLDAESKINKTTISKIVNQILVAHYGEPIVDDDKNPTIH